MTSADTTFVGSTRARSNVSPPLSEKTAIFLDVRWYTCAQVAQILGYGESKVRMLVAQGELRSLKDGRSRRILPEWVEDYVQRRAEHVA